MVLPTCEKEGTRLKSYMGNTDWMTKQVVGEIKEEQFKPVSLIVIILTAGALILNAFMGVR